MSNVLEQLVGNFITSPLPPTVPRDVRPLMLDRKADVFVGMRRSGKTYAMLDVMRRLEGEGVPRDRMLYLNLDDDRLPARNLGLLDAALETYFRLSPDARAETSYIFLDEIQAVPEWERFARRVLDTENTHLFVGGSSSKMLSSEVATTFRGRGFVVEVLPFGFREFTRALGQEPTGLLSQIDRSRLASLADRYLIEGGFPELVGSSDFARAQTLQAYVEMVILKDIVERFGAENIAALKHLSRGLFAANSSQFSVSSFEGTLRSQGFRTTKTTLLTYLDHLVDAFLVFTVPIDSRSAKARTVNPRKVYAIDPGLAAVMHASGAQNRGALLENAVYLELRRRLGPMAAESITYHRTPSGREVDFAIDSPTQPGNRHYVQVCASMDGAAAVERETAALAEAVASSPGSTGTIVTRFESGELQTSVGMIRVVPFWQWALEIS